ncbi:MAG: isocitrate lyase/PEP mutase family protein, partial [Dehalococcoidia bacterium]|nr:isocitrate lyase/PEP mutase family protein [Dehalococcoidia bacterium]
NMAVPDSVPITNILDLADVCRRITRAASLPLVADADDGGVTPVNVFRTVRELEAAGVAAIEIEDNLVPVRLDTTAGRHSLMIPKDEQVGKLKAALAARTDPTTVIVARTTALQEQSLEETLDRIRAYSQAGVDAIMLPGGRVPISRADIEAVHRATSLPILVTTSPPILGLSGDIAADSKFFLANGVKVIYLGVGLSQPPFAMAVKAIYDALKHLKDGGSAEDMKDRRASPELMRSVIQTDEFLKWEREYTPN